MKHHKILMSKGILSDLDKQAEYIVEHNSSKIADEWREGMKKAIYSLSKFPERFPLVPGISKTTKSRYDIFSLNIAFALFLLSMVTLLKLLEFSILNDFVTYIKIL